MHAPNRIVILASLIASTLATPAGANAQVGLQVWNNPTWGAVIDLAALGPLELRWKWDGVGTPSRVVWQLSRTNTTTTSTARDDGIAQEGPLHLVTPGVYQGFKVTPSSSLRLPVYIRVRVDNAGKSVYSRWITVRARTSTTATGTTAGTGATTGTPPSGGLEGVPIRISLSGWDVIRTASSTYENNPNAAGGQPVTVDQMYALTVAIQLNWADIAHSPVNVQATSVLGMTAGHFYGFNVPFWNFNGGAAPIAGRGEDVVMMLALMHRYGNPAISTLKAAITTEVGNALISFVPTGAAGSKEQVRSKLLEVFKRALQNATQGKGFDRPVVMDANGWAELVGGPLSTIAKQLEYARLGNSLPLFVTFGSDANNGGHFRVRLLFHQ